MRLPDEPDSPTQINIVPMIDVIFVVLVFFILSSLFMTRSQNLPVELPAARNSESTEPQSLSITLTATGELWVGRQPSSLDRLLADVQDRRVGDRDFLVIIQADTQVSHGRVIAVMDRLRTLDGAKIGIATTPPPAAPQP